jgi:phage baseplate assembly protein W
MAYGDSGSGSGGASSSVTFKGFSSRAEKQNFKVYDFECAKQDLINRLSVRKGERVENPEFGTIIYDVLFEPFTDELKEQITEDITENLNADPRIATDEILVTEADKGIAIQATLKYVPLNIVEKLRFAFDENALLRLS